MVFVFPNNKLFLTGLLVPYSKIPFLQSWSVLQNFRLSISRYGTLIQLTLFVQGKMLLRVFAEYLKNDLFDLH